MSSTPKERAGLAAVEFSRAVNELGFDVETFAKTIRRDHRSIQQGTMRVFVELLNQWADDADSGNFDQRNEDTVNLARQLLAGVDSTHLSHI